MKKNQPVSFSTAFKYPFARAKRMWNILWILLPIFGWFALGGYGIRLVKEWTAGKFKEMPKFSFVEDMKLGVFMFLKALPFIFVYIIFASILGLVPVFGQWGILFIDLFVMPILGINFMNKQTIESYFEFSILKNVFDNFGDYVVAGLKTIGLFLVFLIMIIVLVGIPALLFTQNIFLADFYRRRVLKK